MKINGGETNIDDNNNGPVDTFDKIARKDVNWPSNCDDIFSFINHLY